VTSLRIWPLCACLSSDLSPGRRAGLAHRVDLIRSLSASWRDPSQICHPVTPPRPVPTSALTLEGDIGRMTMLTEVVDAVIGIDTHRDTHEAVIADVTGKPIAVMRIGNDSAGFARLLAAIAEMAPGPRVAVCIEGSRSYGIGLAPALAAAGLLVPECEQPSRKQRRGKGKSDSIDARLAVLAALRLDTGRLPVPRADGDREALRILLVARQEMTEACTAQAGRGPCCWPATTPTGGPPALPCPAGPLPR
jgi:hypothetical protein